MSNKNEPTKEQQRIIDDDGNVAVIANPGSGKTFLACCMAKSVMIKYDLQMRFITAPDYLKTVGDNFSIGLCL